MRLFSLYIVLILVLRFQLKAQYNYVPNYSFEDKDSCPSELREIDPTCKNWFTPISVMDTIPSIYGNYGSSDYYNLCGTYPVGCLQNVFGYQFPYKGNAYAGIALLSVYHPPNNPYSNYKEYIEVKLKNSLSAEREYCVEFNYSLADDYFNYLPISIEMLLSDTLIKRNRHPILYFEQIIANAQISIKMPILVDTINWNMVSGKFIAKGGEKYLTIGNFKNTNHINNPPSPYSATNMYIYIDDVKLYYCGPDTTSQPTDSMIVPNVFTPNGDGYNDKFVYKNQEQWEYETQIFNRWGNLVFDNNNSENWDGKIEDNLIISGVYFYVIKAIAIKTGEIMIYRGTVTVIY